jgi:transposase
VHAVLAKEGVLPATRDQFGQGGNAQLDGLELGDAYALRVRSLRTLIEAYDTEVATLEQSIQRRLRDHLGYRAIQQIHGIGPTMAAILVAEIGDVSRFRNAEALCSWAGLTPRHRESDTKVHRGGVTKQGSRLVRWAVIERHRPLSRRRQTRRRLASDRRAARQTQSHRRDRPQGPHARLLRPARRRDPLPGQDRVNSSDTTRRAFAIGVTPAPCGEVD